MGRQFAKAKVDAIGQGASTDKGSSNISSSRKAYEAKRLVSPTKPMPLVRHRRLRRFTRLGKPVRPRNLDM